jgi:leucyl aminopeptidase
MTRSLLLRVHPASAGSLPGVPVRTAGGARASTELGSDRTTIEVALADRSLAENRWLIDQVVRASTAMVPCNRAELAPASGVDDDAALTLALDLHNRFHEVRVERAGVANALARIGSLEDGYRAWVDEDPAIRTSLVIAADVEAFARAHDDVTAEVLAEPELRERGLRLLLAVGQGGDASPSRLVTARYAPKGSTAAPLMLLGKGVTFDTGGINVKPYESFVPMMKNDMAGAALAFHLFKGLVEAGHPQPLLLVVPTCENAIGSRAMRPGAIVESHRGHKVRIDHTDAEGRLILADALSYATERFEPERVICFATLTTAALIAYGPYATPIHFADPAFEARLRAASAATGEDLHFFPERIWHFEANRDKEADLRNTAGLPGNAARGAGSRNAAHFLRHFTDTPLCHLDIFASTWNWAGDAPGAGYGATGAPLRTVLRALES